LIGQVSLLVARAKEQAPKPKSAGVTIQWTYYETIKYTAAGSSLYKNA